MRYNYDQLLIIDSKKAEGCYMNAGIIGIGKYVPEKVVTNFDLEKSWILLMNGFVLEQALKNVILRQMIRKLQIWQ